MSPDTPEEKRRLASQDLFNGVEDAYAGQEACPVLPLQPFQYRFDDRRVF